MVHFTVNRRHKFAYSFAPCLLLYICKVKILHSMSLLRCYVTIHASYMFRAHNSKPLQLQTKEISIWSNVEVT